MGRDTLFTGKAHLVGVTCELCEESYAVPESTAHHNDKYDYPNVCSNCNKRMENLWNDMYLEGQVSRLELLADYMEARGFHVKAGMLQDLADQLDHQESVIHAIEEWRAGDFSQDRKGLHKAIDKWDKRKT